MTTYVKLTDDRDQTYGKTQWGDGITHTAPGGGELCTNAWIHVYIDPVLAVLMNSIQGHFNPATMHGWEAEGPPPGATDGTKCGVTSLTTLRRIELPQVTTEQRVWFAILCVQAVRHLVADNSMASWDAWAAGWLNRTDRTEAAAAAAAHAAYAAHAAAHAVAAAHAAAHAAHAAAHAVAAAHAAHAAHAAAHVADAAAYAAHAVAHAAHAADAAYAAAHVADAAAYAAHAVAAAHAAIDFVALARQACQVEEST